MYILRAPTHVFNTIHNLCEEKITGLHNMMYSASVNHMPENLRDNFRAECDRLIDDISDVLLLLNTQLEKEQ